MKGGEKDNKGIKGETYKLKETAYIYKFCHNMF